MKQQWRCPRCGIEITLFVTPSQPPTCECRLRLKGKKQPIPMKAEGDL